MYWLGVLLGCVGAGCILGSFAGALKGKLTSDRMRDMAMLNAFGAILMVVANRMMEFGS